MAVSDQTYLEPRGSHQSDPFTSQDSQSGLTAEEQVVMDHLLAAWNGYVNLPVQHPADLPEFMHSFHDLQRLMGMRVVRRDHPAFWRGGGSEGDG
jgi:hypothetical protein